MPERTEATAGAEPLIRWGLLGWSNKRTGLEFYRWDDKTIPRHGSEWGDLLTQSVDFPDAEGSPVLVIVLPRNARREDLFEQSQVIRRAFAAAASGGGAAVDAYETGPEAGTAMSTSADEGPN